MATWPSLIQPQTLPRFFLQNPSRSGGVALNGQEQTIGSGAERWRMTGTFFVGGKAAILQFEAFLTAMMGRAGECEVPTFSGRLANWPVDSAGRVLHPGITRNRLLDGTAYEDPEVPSTSEIAATLSAASIGATSITATVTQGQKVEAGQLFGHGNRLYRILTAGVPVAGAQALTFRPKLRAAVSGGATMKLSRPVCLMKFASDDEGADLDTLFGGPVTLNFVEAF